MWPVAQLLQQSPYMCERTLRKCEVDERLRRRAALQDHFGAAIPIVSLPHAHQGELLCNLVMSPESTEMNMRVVTPLPLLPCASSCRPSRLFPLISITHASARTHQRSIASHHAHIPQRAGPVICFAPTKKKREYAHTHRPSLSSIRSEPLPLSSFYSPPRICRYPSSPFSLSLSPPFFLILFY